MTEQELHELVNNFNAKARPAVKSPNDPATVADIDNLVSQATLVFSQIIAELHQN